jgi:SnoaL-like polyketide cyclase
MKQQFLIIIILIFTVMEANAQTKKTTIGREFYEGFQRNEFSRWDKIMDKDIEFFSPTMTYGAPNKGIDALKIWGGEFIKALSPRVDLVDEFESENRGFITITLNWKHVEPFFGLSPSGREGTSVETFTYTIKDGKMVNFIVSDVTLDLALYFYSRGWNTIANKHPKPIIKGIERNSPEWEVIYNGEPNLIKK